METAWRLTGDNMETHWRQNGKIHGDKPCGQTWRQQWRQMETNLRQNAHFYEVKWKQNGVNMETKND